MLIIEGKRNTGKTSALIGLAHINGATLVVADNVNKKSAIKRAKELGLTIKEPITYARYLDVINNEHSGYSMDSDEKYYLDEAYRFLEETGEPNIDYPNLLGYSRTAKYDYFC